MLEYVTDFYEKTKEDNIGAANITGDVTGDYQIAKEPQFDWLNKEASQVEPRRSRQPDRPSWTSMLD